MRRRCRGTCASVLCTRRLNWKRQSYCVAIATSAAGKMCKRSKLGGTLARNFCEQVRWTTSMGQLFRVDANNTAIICFVRLNSRGGCELGKPYEHIKELPIPMTDKPRIQFITTYLQCAAYQLGLTGGTTRRTPVLFTHRATMDDSPLLTNDTRLYFVMCCFTNVLRVRSTLCAVGSEHSLIVYELPPLDRWKRCGK